MKNKTIKLDIGSGRAKFEDYITVDNDPSVGADICVDIENAIVKNYIGDELVNDDGKLSLIYNDNVDEIRAHHILEHIRPENKVKVMALFFDLLKPGGMLDIEVPLFPHPQSVQDPTHISFWNKESFWYFIKGNNFGEAFAKRYSQYPVPLFELVNDEDKNWQYQILLRKPKE